MGLLSISVSETVDKEVYGTRGSESTFVVMPRFWILTLLLLLLHSSAGSNTDKGLASFAATPPPSDERRMGTEQGHPQFDESLDSFVRSLLACKDGARADGKTAQLACVMAQVCSISYCSTLRLAVSIGARCAVSRCVALCRVALRCVALRCIVSCCVVSHSVVSCRIASRTHVHARA